MVFYCDGVKNNSGASVNLFLGGVVQPASLFTLSDKPLKKLEFFLKVRISMNIMITKNLITLIFVNALLMGIINHPAKAIGPIVNIV
ncbi:MAG: hypothetical protein C0582_04825 [Alphaproteobacteria bacterium]|nr:MAG: hypothetical protein C0582_04825 [Alphaproteobacteria bacterium]